MKSARVLTCQQTVWRELCTARCHLATLLNTSQVNTLASLIPHHSLVLDLGQLDPGKRLAMQKWSGGLVCGQGGAAAAIVSTYLGGASRIPANSIVYLPAY